MTLTDYKFYHILTAFPFVDQIWLFGSRARKDSQDRADIDLAVFCPKASNRDWLDVLNVIDEADTLLEIDCVRLDELDDSSPLKESILTQGVKLYERV
ncbi:MAG: nucleotidyltransferase domain-containing protein [Alphaproteobacteria bacterium]|nr:nucleotidyltransferase domain-containing protein [Alphaproteobacteria bacterium]